MHIIINQ